MKICVHRRGYSWYVWHALTCTHINLSICPYVYRVTSAARSWKYVKKCQFRWQKYVFTQIDTDRFVYLHVSISPTTPVLSEHCRAPVLQQQPPHRAAMWGHTWHVSRANSSFPRVRGRKRREKCAAGHSGASSAARCAASLGAAPIPPSPQKLDFDFSTFCDVPVPWGYRVL